MKPRQPFFREAGHGPGVVCLHANASTSAQWRPLMERLAPRLRVLAPALRRVQLVHLESLGHMGPVTHPAAVNAEIERFLLAHADPLTPRS